MESQPTLTELFHVVRAKRPMLVSVPHAGTRLPPGLVSRFSASARTQPDTDWYVDRLYDWVTEIGAGMITARYSRLVVDLNRPPDDERLYQGETTGLVPLSLFSGEPVYRREPPDASEIRQRVAQYWQPYHAALQDELERIRDQHGIAILLDAHSIASRVPRLFEGRLPDLNLGTWEGRSAAPALAEVAKGLIAGQARYSHVVDGRFKGGYITRHYGQPGNGIHALQLEMAQSVYLDERHLQWNPPQAEMIQAWLRTWIESILRWGEAHA